MMDITKSREEFEDWVAHQLGHTIEYVKGQRAVTTDRYYSEYIEINYQAWKASRESLVIDLPPRQALCASGYGDGYFVPSDSGEGLEYDEVIDALRTAGIRIKGESE